MTQTIKAPPTSGAGKPGQSSRSNPVCLEVTLTIRSLPGEQGGAVEPFRDEVKTVIVFDNGAVLRSTRNMPVGQKVIVSNQSGQDVVCCVVGGQNLPSVKGYVEVEFVEPVSNFWRIQQTAGPSASASNPIIPLPKVAPPVAPVLEPPPMYRPADGARAAAAEPGASAGSGPSFEDVAGLINMPSIPATPAPKPRPDRSTLGAKPKQNSDYGRSEDTNTSSVGDWNPASAEPPAASQKAAARNESAGADTSAALRTPSRDFMSKGLMAYDKSAAGGSKGRAPMVVGIAALVLGTAGVVMFFLREPGKSSEPTMNMGALTRVTTPSYPSVSDTPAHPAAAENQAAPKIETQPLPDDLDQPPAASTLAAVPAVVTNAGAPDSRPALRTTRNVEKNAVPTKPIEKPSSHAPAIPNLKMSSPSTPNKNLGTTTESAGAMTEVAATEPVQPATPAGLLTSAGRTSKPPVAPPSAPAIASSSAPAAAIVREPKLLSSTKPVYPPTARQASIEGDVVVAVNIDASGSVVGVTALSGPLTLRQAAVDSVRQWKYSPGLTDGKPTPAQVTVNLQFRLK